MIRQANARHIYQKFGLYKKENAMKANIHLIKEKQ